MENSLDLCTAEILYQTRDKTNHPLPKNIAILLVPIEIEIEIPSDTPSRIDYGIQIQIQIQKQIHAPKFERVESRWVRSNTPPSRNSAKRFCFDQYIVIVYGLRFVLVVAIAIQIAIPMKIKIRIGSRRICGI